MRCIKSLLIIVLMLSAITTEGAWKRVGGIEDGNISSITSVGRRLYITTGSGLYYSVNGDIHWQQIGTGLPENMSCSNLVMMRKDSSDTLLFMGTQFGLYESIDMGISWELVRTGWPGSRITQPLYTIRNLVVAGSNLFASVQMAVGKDVEYESGLYHSNDYGQNWRRIDTAIALNTVPQAPEIFLTHTDTTPGWNLFAMVPNRGLFRYAHDDSWIAVDSGLPDSVSFNVARSYADLSLPTPVLYSCGGDNGYGIYSSDDGGISWSSIDTSLKNYLFNDMISIPVHGGISLLASIFDGDRQFDLMRSDNSGATWEKLNPAFCGGIRPLYGTVDNQGDTMVLAGTINGLYRSSDRGTTWSECNAGLSSGVVSSMVACTAGTGSTYLFAINLCMGAVFRSEDNGNSWKKVYSNDGCAQIQCIKTRHRNNGETEILAGSMGLGILQSSDYGENWTSTKLTSDPKDDTVFSLDISPDNAVIYAGTQSGLCISSDSGRTWLAVQGWDSKWANVGIGSEPVRDIAIANDTANNKTLFVGDGAIGISASFYRSTDNGDTWKWIDSSLIGEPPSWYSGYIATIPDGKGNSTVLLTAGPNSIGSSVLKSNDLGDNWLKADSGLPGRVCNPFYPVQIDNKVTVCAVSTVNGHDIYISIYVDSFNCWIPFDSTLQTSISALGYCNTDLFAGMQFAKSGSGSIWKMPIKEIATTIKKINHQPGKRYLGYTLNYHLQKESLALRFTLPHTGVISIDAYALSGVKVATVFSGCCSAGDYRVVWDWRRLSPGLYLITMRAGSNVLSKPLCLYGHRTPR